MGRRKVNAGKDLIDIGALLPWWLSLVLAIGAYFLFQNLAAIETGAGTSTDIGQVLPKQLLKTGAMLAQYGVPAFLLIGAISALFKRKKRAHLLESVANGNSIDTLDSLTWQQFEDLVHEYFRRQGYEVKETSKGPDGGIDLKLRKDGKPATVQCKHWRNKKVGVNVIREQFGIMAAESVSEGFVVTSGQFTEDAYAFARGKPLKLIDGEALRKHLGAVDVQSQR
jgi:restriction system protein